MFQIVDRGSLGIVYRVLTNNPVIAVSEIYRLGTSCNGNYGDSITGLVLACTSSHW